jgi:hypothetical protein
LWLDRINALLRQAAVRWAKSASHLAAVAAGAAAGGALDVGALLAVLAAV